MRLVDVALERAHSSTQEDLGEYLTYASERHRTSHFMANVGRRLPGGSPAAGAGCGRCPPDDTAPSEFCLITMRATSR